MVWASCYGAKADQRVRDRLRYLRALGVPEGAVAGGAGRGNQLRYGFLDLVETGLGLTALGLGLRPADIAAVLVGQRAVLRPIYARTWREIAEPALAAPWVRSRGRIGAMVADEVIVRLHDRHVEPAKVFDLIGADEIGAGLPMFEPIERVGGLPPRRLLPLKRLMIQWVAWAMEAPDIRPGRKA